MGSQHSGLPSSSCRGKEGLIELVYCRIKQSGYTVSPGHSIFHFTQFSLNEHLHFNAGERERVAQHSSSLLSSIYSVIALLMIASTWQSVRIIWEAGRAIYSSLFLRKDEEFPQFWGQDKEISDLFFSGN